MGNMLGRRRSVVDEKYTKPQGLYQHKDIDIKKLKKLILESKLAPCYPGDEDCRCDLEECPICFLSYPSLNRSRCCSKSICTECFLQLKMPNVTRPTQCPFCKSSGYAVEYRGTKTKKEKSIEQIEEQRVIEAKIRMRHQELQEEEEKLRQRQETLSSNRMITSSEGNYGEATCSASSPLIMLNPPDSRPSGDGEFSVDLDDIMLMEAIWLSMQENSMSISDDYITSEHDVGHNVPYITSTPPPASSSAGGLASAMATLVEHQQIGGRECSTSYDNNASSLTRLPTHSMIHGSHSQRIVPYQEFHTPMQRPHDSRLSFEYLTEQEDNKGGFRCISRPIIIPESFEEQMTLAMTLSLAEAHAPIPTHRGIVPRH